MFLLLFPPIILELSLKCCYLFAKKKILFEPYQFLKFYLSIFFSHYIWRNIRVFLKLENCQACTDDFQICVLRQKYCLIFMFKNCLDILLWMSQRHSKISMTKSENITSFYFRKYSSFHGFFHTYRNPNYCQLYLLNIPQMQSTSP